MVAISTVGVTLNFGAVYFGRRSAPWALTYSSATLSKLMNIIILKSNLGSNLKVCNIFSGKLALIGPMLFISLC